MYIPKDNQNENQEEIRAFIEENGFGILVSIVEKKHWATHIPLKLFTRPDGVEVLEGHIAKANPQWQELIDGQEVLVIFNGPHAYISSSWYDHINVPTWNYLAVHAYGKYRKVEGDALIAALSRLTDKYEAASVKPVSVADYSSEFMKSHLRALVGFEIEITDIQAKYKLSQNRDDKNHSAIVEELEKRGDAQSAGVAEKMKNSRAAKYDS